MISKDPYLSFFSALPLPAMILEPHGSGFMIIDANEAFLNLCGKKKEDVLHEKIENAFPENPNQANSGYQVISSSLKKALLTRRSQKVVDLRYDIPASDLRSFQERYWTSDIVPIQSEDGRPEYLLLTTRDVTEEVLCRMNEQEFQDEIVRLKGQYQHFFEGNPDAMYSLDLDGKFLSANEGTARLLEIPMEELLNSSFLPFCGPDDKEEIWAQFQKGISGEPAKLEANFISSRGKEKILSVSIVPMVINGEIKGAYGIAKDLTWIRNSERIIIEKRRFLDVNASFIKALFEKDVEDKALQEAFENIGKTIGVDRTYYFIRHKDPETGKMLYSQKNEWSSKNASSQLHNTDLQNIPEENLEDVLGPLKQKQPFFSSIREIPPGPVREAFLEQDIRSMLLYPIFVDQDFHGFIGFDDCMRERVWTQDEITFLKTLAHNLGGALEKQNAVIAAKQKEEHLANSERKFRSLVQEGSDVIAILDCEANYLFVSDNSVKILQMEPRDFLGRNAFEFIHPDDSQRLKNELARLQMERQIKIPPFKFKDSKGNWRWLETTATNLLEDPAVQGIITNSRDVTTLVEQALEIEQINERYALAAKATEDLIYDWDLEKDEVIRFQESATQVFGYSAEEVNQKEFWLAHIHPEDREKEYGKLQEYLKDPAVNFIKTKYRFRKADGTFASVIDKGYVLRDDSGKAKRLIGATSDVSDIARKEEALTMANTRFELAMQATNEIIWDWDVVNDFVIRSAAFEKNYGYFGVPTNSVRSFWLNTISKQDQDRVRTSLFEALDNREQQKWREEYRLIKENGEQADIIDRGYIVRDNKGKAIRVVGAILDVTESRRLLREIKKQNQGLKEIAWKQSHEVRAPLARLMGLLHLLQMGESKDLDRQEIMDHIFCSANELDKIVREIVTKSEAIAINPEEKDAPSPDRAMPRFS